MRVFRKFLPYLVTVGLVCSIFLFSALAEQTVQDPAPKAPAVRGELIQGKAYDPQLSQRLNKYDLLRLNGAAAADQIRRTGRLLLRTSSGDFDLQLTPHDLRAPGYVAQTIGADGVAHQLPKAPVQTYKGSIAGNLNAQARFTLTDSGLEGLLINGSERYFIEPAKSVSTQAKADEFVFYRSGDVVPASGECGVTLADEIAAGVERAGAQAKSEIESIATTTNPIGPLSPMKIVRLATDADGEYVAQLGGAAAANARIVSIMNQVDAVYQVELGIAFQIVFQNTWSDAGTDPYTTSDPSPLLGEFRNHWNANFTHVSRSLAHLWTGKSLLNNVIGIASINVVCRSPSFSYGLSQRFPTSGVLNVQSVALTAHEMGHNFSGLHTNLTTNEIPRDIEPSCAGLIMQSSIGTSNSFCTFSRSQIIGFAFANPGCLLDSASVPPAPSTCSETLLSATTQTINGSLDTTDCRSPARGITFYADRYAFDGMAGQQITISMNRTGSVLDPYLYLIGPSGYVLIPDNNGNGGVNALIGNPFTLPYTGRYIIEATSAAENQTEGYALNLTFLGCTRTVSPTSIQAPAAGVSGNLTIGGDCTGTYQFRVYANSIDGGWLTNEVAQGTGNQNLGYTISPNTNAAGRHGFLIVGGSGSAFTFGGLRVPVYQSGTGPDCQATPIAFGQTINSSLTTSDCQSPIRGNGFYSKRFSFNAAAGQRVAISATSVSLDSFLTLIGPDNAVIINNDDGGGGINARIPGGQGVLTLGVAGTYIIEINGFSFGGTGPFALTLTTTAGATQLSSSSFNVAENAGSVNITVNRSGDTSSAAAIDFATTGPSSGNCGVVNGTALQNCDYAITEGTLTFAPGDTSKSFTVLITDDLYVEGNETFNVALTNAVGTTLSGQSSATVTINDNDTVQPTTNIIDQPEPFVRQHYFDLLARVPDPGGLGFWTNEVQMCGGDPTCYRRRVEVSNAFFYENEYQRTGSYVFRLYRAAYGNDQPFPNPDNANLTESKKIPSYAVFVRDRTRVIDSPDVAQSQLNLANLFVTRPEFTARYPLSLTGQQFVEAILQTIRTAGSELGPQQAALLNVFNQGGRGAVLYRLADDNPATNPVNNQVFVTNEYNRAFVFTEYAGYLRRDSDINGFLFWLNIVNQRPVRDPIVQQSMVCAFITSAEYQQRFSPVVTRNDTRCAQ